MSSKAPILHIDSGHWIQAFRRITHATNERTMLADNLPLSAVGDTSPIISYTQARAISSSLVMANLNSLPLDWAARLSLGGTNMSFFILRQLPVLPPEKYLDDACRGAKYVELVVPRVLELTYTAHDLEPFAKDLGYEGPPFVWDDGRRHRLKSELDAIYAHMYQLERDELKYILDAPPPSASFPTLKRNECKEFNEYRTKRYVLAAYDQMARGELPDLSDE